MSALVLGQGGGQAATWPGPHWARAAPQDEGLDPAGLAEAAAYLEFAAPDDGASELVIIRHGRVVWTGPRADARHPVWSCTKTFTSTVLGLLVDEGKCSLEDLAVRYIPELDDEYPAYGAITLRHLATMTSGYEGTVRDITSEREWGDPMGYLLPRPPLAEPGARWQYDDHGVHILGAILTGVAGESLADVFRQHVADPIGMNDWDWGVCGEHAGVTLSNASGVHGTGISTTALDMARFGLLYLRRGRWGDQQLLSGSWVDEATTNQVSRDIEYANWDARGRYGFFWFTNGVMADGARPWPSAPSGGYSSHGACANFCTVVPEWDMVIVRMGTTPIGNVAETDSIWGTFLGKVGASVKREIGDRAAANAALRGSKGEMPEDNELCFTCHANFREETLAKTHLSAGVACAMCHGISYEHMNDETSHTKPDVLFGRAEVTEFCSRCHEEHKGPDKVDAFLAEWKGRTRPNGRLIVQQAMCTDCHGEHAILRVPVMGAGAG